MFALIFSYHKNMIEAGWGLTTNSDLARLKAKRHQAQCQSCSRCLILRRKSDPQHGFQTAPEQSRVIVDHRLNISDDYTCVVDSSGKVASHMGHLLTSPSL